MKKRAVLPLPKESEKAFMHRVMDFAKWHGYKVCHISDSRRQVRPGVFVGDVDCVGFPDLILCHVKKSRLIFAELKSADGVLTAGQRDWLAALDGVDAETYIWKPADWDEITRVLARS